MATLEEYKAMNRVVTAMLEENEAVHYNLNEFFLVTMAVIIFFMQAGFAFLEAGSVRSKNTTNILLKNVVESCIGGIFYWIFGWAFAYGSPSNPFIGFGEFASPPEEKYALWFFQFVFAATTSTIVSGAVAERCDFVPFLVYSVMLTGFVYPVVSHWAWAGDGWLATLGYSDFAGSGVVHVVGGTFAFIGAFLLGPRIGRFSKAGEPVQPIPGHSVALVALGAFILMFGFFAFNGGSQASISSPGDGLIVARGMFNTIISGAFAALTAMIISRFRLGKWSLLVTINAALTGMVAICAGCNSVYHWGAAAIGTSGGIVYLLVATLVALVKVDDPLDATAVHFGGGCWGVLMQPFFAIETGIWFNFTRDSFLGLAWNVIGLFAIIGWCAVWAFIIFGSLKLAKVLRVSPEVETKGLDIFKHGEPVYPAAAYGHLWGDAWESSGVKEHPELQALGTIHKAKSEAGSVYSTGVRARQSPGQATPNTLYSVGQQQQQHQQQQQYPLQQQIYPSMQGPPQQGYYDPGYSAGYYQGYGY